MENIFVEFLPPWVLTGRQPAFYDKESGTVLQQTARMYDRVNMLVRMFNKLSKNTKDEIESFETTINETVDDYIGKFNDLHDYVMDYFDNLDVQEEINNKLDDMVEQGTLQPIIYEYLNSVALFTYDTVADMKLATNFVNGSYAKTLGYYSRTDKGGAIYKIRTKTGADTADEMTLIALSDNTLIAELVISNEMTIKQFGGNCDGTNNDTSYAEAMISKCNYLDLGGFTCVLQAGITIPDNCIIRNGVIKITTNGTIFTGTDLNSLLVENVEFQATTHKDNPSYDNNLINISESENITIRNCKINDACCGFNFVNCENIIAHDNEITGVSRFGFNFGTDNYNFGTIKNVVFYNNFMHDNPYIPLKFTGYIENIDVFGNTGFNNTDSEETACFSFKNCKIHDNVFHDDTNRNIGFKQLDLTEYPLPADAPETLYAENVEIYNNSCFDGNHNGINIQIYYDYNTKDINIHDNEVISSGTDGYTGIRIGVLNSTTEKCCKIYNNLVEGKTIGQQGILLVNANYCEVYNNTVLDFVDSLVKVTVLTGFYDSYNIKSSHINIYDNKLESFTGSCRCVFFATTISGSTVDDDITDVSIIHNNFNVKTTANQIQDKPTLTLISQNYDGVNLYDTTPTRRSANYTIYYAKDPGTAGCIGWIATGSIVTPTYKQYIPVS